ncbi:Acetoin dehydrogenase E1 component beta-subunit [Streptococcus sp. DD10]|uniref:alpha-ketoacid dehydrogenase subunit beta n=1 Tax=Streptococcus sp. DD10 TaxID=1777878 RepID=UPI00079456A0|nr:transketolase C-terminal domain-containing protein [Streptococcus sp. DD10]KXT72403.1 Acetoin dehydrogenase E1 component beta-subunit [Streptococcus sp. DD10]
MSGRELTYIEAVREGLAQILERYPESFILGEDVGAYGGAFGASLGLAERFSGRVLDTPISEAAITGLATGAALLGKRPILEIQFSDFVTVAMDQLVNQLAKIPYLMNCELPVIIRMATGAGTGAGVQHSQSLEAWFSHIPGLQVIEPSTPYDAKGALFAAIHSNKPTLIFEPKILYKEVAQVPIQPYLVELGRSRVLVTGEELTIITVGSMVPLCQQVVNSSLVSIHLLDLFSIAPLDRAGILKAAEKTGRVLIVTESYGYFGIAAEVMASLIEQGFKGEMRRLTSQFSPIPASKHLEQAIIPSQEDILRAIKGMMNENKNEK